MSLTAKLFNQKCQVMEMTRIVNGKPQQVLWTDLCKFTLKSNRNGYFLATAIVRGTVFTYEYDDNAECNEETGYLVSQTEMVNLLTEEEDCKLFEFIQKWS